MAARTVIQMRTDKETKKILNERALKYGFSSLTEYMIFVGLNAEIKVSVNK